MKLTTGLLVIGNLNIDRIYRVNDIPLEGKSTPISDEAEVFGGSGGNISSAASKLGLRVKLSSVVGRDLPVRYRDDLQKIGVDLEPTRISDSKRTPYCIIFSAPGGRQIYAFNPGSMEEQRSMKVPLDHALSHTHIATSNPEFSIRAARELSKIGSSVAIDPGMELFFRWSRDQIDRVLPCCDRFFGNIGEWKHLGEKMGLETETVLLGGRRIPSYPEIFENGMEAIITLGAGGSVLIGENGIDHEGSIDTGTVLDATGAGDAFRGGFYASLLRGNDSAASLRYANAMGALCIRSKFPQDYEADWGMLRKTVEK